MSNNILKATFIFYRYLSLNQSFSTVWPLHETDILTSLELFKKNTQNLLYKHIFDHVTDHPGNLHHILVEVDKLNINSTKMAQKYFMDTLNSESIIDSTSYSVIQELALSLINEDKEYYIFNPRLMFTDTFLKIHQKFNKSTLVGVSDNPAFLNLVKMQLVMHNIVESNINIVDELNYPNTVFSKYHYDIIFDEAIKDIDLDLIKSELIDVKLYRTAVIEPVDYNNIFKSMEQLKEDGIYIMLAHDSLIKSVENKHILNKLLLKNLVDTIIKLPSYLNDRINTQFYIIIFKKNRKPNELVFEVDLSGKTVDISLDGIKAELLHILKKRSLIKGISKFVTKDCIIV